MTIELPGSEVLADFHQFVARIHRIDSDAAVRIGVYGTVAVISSAPIYPVGLGDTMPLALAMRMLPIIMSHTGDIDVVVPASGLLDRFARAVRTDTLDIDIPPQRMSRSWTGIAPPRSGWELSGETRTDQLGRIAEAGITEISQGSPEGSGAHAVSALRRAVWGRELTAADLDAVHLPAGLTWGVAFALEACGFLTGRVARIFTAPGWVRVSTPFGHVLTRDQSL